MAWYLSEVVTDLSPIQDLLRVYALPEAFPEERLDEEYINRLLPVLRQASLNIDHIDTDTIPTAYENDEYKWLAAGYHALIGKLGLISDHRGERDHLSSFELTDNGSQVLQEAFSMPDLMKLRLPEWRNDCGIQPYPEIIRVVTELKRRNLYPCGGLLLLEFFLVLQNLNTPNGSLSSYRKIYEKRREYYPHMAGERRVDLIQYSHFLWEQMSQELSNYFNANYPARATLQLMMYVGDLVYGPVPDELFGMVQYVTVA